MKNILMIESLEFDINSDRSLAIFEYQMDMINNDMLYESADGNESRIKKIISSFVTFIQTTIENFKDFISKMIEKIKTNKVTEAIKRLKGGKDVQIKSIDYMAYEKELENTVTKLTSLIAKYNKLFSETVKTSDEIDKTKIKKITDECDKVINTSSKKLEKILSTPKNVNSKELLNWCEKNLDSNHQFTGSTKKWIDLLEKSKKSVEQLKKTYLSSGEISNTSEILKSTSSTISKIGKFVKTHKISIIKTTVLTLVGGVIITGAVKIHNIKNYDKDVEYIRQSGEDVKERLAVLNQIDEKLNNPNLNKDELEHLWNQYNELIHKVRKNKIRKK